MNDFDPEYFEKTTFSKEQISGYLANARRDFEIAEKDRISEVRFTFAYQVLVKAGVACLAHAGYSVVIIDNLSTGKRGLVPNGASFTKGDLRVKADIKRLFSRYHVDAVMHFAASSIVPESVAEPLKYYENNVGATSNLLQVMLDRRKYVKCQQLTLKQYR